MTAPCWRTSGIFGDRSCSELASVVHCRNCPIFSRAAAELFEQAPPSGYAELWSERIAASPPAPEPTTSVVLFRLGAERLALDTSLLREVASLRPVHPIPHRTHTLLEGLVNIRGQLLLCVALDGLLEIPRPEPKSAGRLLVLEHRGEAWVFAADEVFGVERFPSATLAAPPSTLPAPLAGVTRGIFPWHGSSVGYLQGDSLMAALARGLV